MVDEIKGKIAELLSMSQGLPIEAAQDVVDEVQRIINDINNDKDYKYLTKEDVLSEYLGLTTEYLWVFED